MMANSSATTVSSRTGGRVWRAAPLHTLAVAALMLSLFAYWFAVADRYIVFLYHHDMGPLVPDTSPFSRVTSSRYWMAGLVASGALLVLYGAANWLLGRLWADYRPPSWRRVWALCAGPLLVGLPLITLTLNRPTLRPANAAQVTLAALVGLALVLLPGGMAARRPRDLVWWAADGWGLMWVLSALTSLERIPRWLDRGGTLWVRMTGLAFLVGVAWLLIVSGLLFWRRRPAPGAAQLFTAGLCVAYLLMPLLHHVVGSDGYYYISDSDNFFTSNVPLQVATWLVVAGVAAGLTRLRQALETRRR